MAVDLAKLVNDPKFQALPPDRRRAVLEHAGASPEFIDKLLANEEVQPPQPTGPSGGAEERFVKGFTHTALPDMGTVGRVASAATHPPVELDVQDGRVTGLKSEAGGLLDRKS